MRAPASTASQHRRRGLLLASLLLPIGYVWQSAARPAEETVEIPPPALDPPPVGPGPQKAIFAGGCFWGVQGVYQHVKGVQRAVAGYSGGTPGTADYMLVSRGTTDHAESVELTYDPAQVSYGALLQIFFSVVHDPTQLDRQGPDVGTQYRSAIFAANASQWKTAQGYIAQLDAAKCFPGPIVTQLVDKPSFYIAEVTHQDFMAENPRHPYIAAYDLPKLHNLQRLFPARFRTDPVLVKTSA